MKSPAIRWPHTVITDLKAAIPFNPDVIFFELWSCALTSWEESAQISGHKGPHGNRMNRTRCRQRRIAACTVGALHGKEVCRSYGFSRGTMDCPPKWIWCEKGATKIDEKKHGRIQENLETLQLIMVLNPAKISDSRLDWSHPSTSQLYDSIWGQGPLTKPFTRWCSPLMSDGLVSPRELVRYIFHSHP